MGGHSEETIVCYCSEISVKEIRNAVEHGCETIDEVHNFSDKHITGNCKVTSPDGKCCRERFKEMINKLRK